MERAKAALAKITAAYPTRLNGLTTQKTVEDKLRRF
jgi:hypothetical protein